MKPDPETDLPASASPPFEEAAVCDECGRFGAFDMGERKLCRDCYQGAGSCCPEFGKDDPWEFRDRARPSD